jgi:hypothetical protein
VAVSADGNTFAVATPYAVVNSQTGAVYVFTRSANSSSFVAKLTASDGAANDNSGSTVALSGDGFHGTVALSCSGGPLNSKCSALPSCVTVSGTAAVAIVSVQLPQHVTKGLYSVTITATDATTMRVTSVAVQREVAHTACG